MKKKIFIGVGLLAVGALGYLALKNKRKKEEVEQNLIEAEGEADFDFENADGKKKTGLQGIINKPKKIIKVKDYQALMKNGSLNNLKKYLIGKNIYTLQNGVNIREMKPEVDNGFFFDNLFLTIKNKGVYIGKVDDVVRGVDGKNIWFLISNKEANSALFGEVKFDWSDYFFVRADVVVVDLY